MPLDLSNRPIFDWPYFKVATIYNENSTRVRFGGGYTFAARPNGPPQRTFKLKFEALIWETDANGALSTTIRPETNLRRLELFYRDVETWKLFWFKHPADGYILVRFNKPLEIPQGFSGGAGSVGPIELDLIEQILPWPTPTLPSLP